MTEAARAVEAGKSFAVAADLIQTGASGWLEATGKVKASFSVDESGQSFGSRTDLRFSHAA